MITDDQSTDTSSSRIAIPDEPLFIEPAFDVIERPASNPFEGSKLLEDAESDEIQLLFQGMLLNRIYYCISANNGN